MNSEQDLPPASSKERREKLRQLEHDIKSYLGVVTMGMQALQLVRDDPDEFDKMRKTIEDDGVKPMNAIIAQVFSMAHAELG